MAHAKPALHNAMWPGLVGKGGPDAEPTIDLDTMLDLTAKARANGTKFDGVDLFLFDPHVSIDSTNDDLEAARRQDPREGAGRGIAGRAGVAADRRRVGDGSADEQKAFLTQVRKACTIGRKLENLGIRRYGVIRIDSAASPADWAKDPAGNTKKIADTFQKAADIAESTGERLADRRGDLLGRHAQRAAHGGTARDGQPAADRRVPGRHGAHAALHHGLQRARGSHPARRSSTGRIRAALDAGLEDDDRRAAPVDVRLPRRAERRAP